jgi:DNA polymerase III subunit epsilon
LISRALIVDLETDGVDPSRDRMLELGAILYSVPAQTTLLQFSALLPVVPPTNAAEHVNGISVAALEAALTLEFDAHFIALQMLALADVVVCHNGLEFDRVFLGKAWHHKPWIDTKHDVAWPKGRPGDSLVNTALAHGVAVASAHRALTDCGLIASLFDRQPDLQALLTRALRPKHIFRAIVEYDQRQAAKDAGFSWDPTRKWWLRRMCAADVTSLPFNVARVES